MSPLVFLTEFQELFTLDCEETTSEENNATASQVKRDDIIHWLAGYTETNVASDLYDTPWPYFQHFTPGCEEKHCLFVCLFFKTLFIYLHGFPHMHRNKRTRPFAASHLCRTKPSCWRAKVALRQDKQSKLLFEINYVFLLFVQPRPQGAVPWHWRWVPTSKAREKRPGDEVAVWLVPVRRLLSSVVVLYHVNG